MTAAATTTPLTNPHPHSDSLRDTIDSIIIAFILAFVFRAFVVEAFIIPTGSMAPTLYGQHGQIRCKNCAYPWAYNIAQLNGQDVVAVFRSQSIHCPNCGDENEVVASKDKPLPPDSGDRILVLKWPYDIGGSLLGPKRWDVAVFKEPADSRTNFIKRLIGLPGDVLEFIDGDLYAAKSSDVPDSVRNKLQPYHRQPLTDADYKALDRVLKLQRKTPVAQSSLWMLHYDNDFLPTNRDAFTPAWVADRGDSKASGWKTDTPRLKFDGRGIQSMIHLSGKHIQDTYGYNNVVGTPQYPIYVGDVRLEFVLNPTAASGKLILSLVKDRVEFRAEITSDGVADLFAYRPERPAYPEPLDHKQIAPFSPDHPIALAFENVDYRVTLEVDGQPVLRSSDDAYKPNLAMLRGLWEVKLHGGGNAAQVGIGAESWPLEIWHVRVLRDEYYRPYPGEQDDTGQLAGGGAATCGHPILLRPGEYFMCGDNSPQSYDSRMWVKAQVSPFLQTRGEAYQVGTVPEDQLIGRAFFVYWPSGNRLSERGGVPLIPNTGRMRIIR